MEHASLLNAWESFYVIVGSSSAALIGLQFVVIVLSAEAMSARRIRRRRSPLRRSCTLAPRCSCRPS